MSSQILIRHRRELSVVGKLCHSKLHYSFLIVMRFQPILTKQLQQTASAARGRNERFSLFQENTQKQKEEKFYI